MSVFQRLEKKERKAEQQYHYPSWSTNQNENEADGEPHTFAIQLLGRLRQGA
jgi:hypothetical protein